MEEWKTNPSRKLDAIAQIINWHLKEDNQPPLRVDNNELVPNDSWHGKELSGDLPPDKAVIHLAFPSSFPQVSAVRKVVLLLVSTVYNDSLKQLLDIYGVKYVSISGHNPPSTRTKIIQDFRSSGRDGARVLLLSNVGLTGLNLPCANILIVVVSSRFNYICND